MAQDTVTNLAEMVAEIDALDNKIDGEVERIDDEIGEVNGNLANLDAKLPLKSYVAFNQVSNSSSIIDVIEAMRDNSMLQAPVNNGMIDEFPPGNGLCLINKHDNYRNSIIFNGGGNKFCAGNYHLVSGLVLYEYQGAQIYPVIT